MYFIIVDNDCDIHVLKKGFKAVGPSDPTLYWPGHIIIFVLVFVTFLGMISRAQLAQPLTLTNQLLQL